MKVILENALIMKKKSSPFKNLRLTLSENKSCPVIELIGSKRADVVDDTEDPSHRRKRDTLHEFQELPLGKTFPVNDAICRLLIQGAFFIIENLRE